MRFTATLAGIAVAAVLGVVPVAADEQTITPLTPPEEQQVQVIHDGGAEAQVRGVEGSALAAVEPHEPPSPAEKAASNAGKVVLGVTAAAVALGAMTASLLLL